MAITESLGADPAAVCPQGLDAQHGTLPYPSACVKSSPEKAATGGRNCRNLGGVCQHA
jgi:hypothetical protein